VGEPRTPARTARLVVEGMRPTHWSKNLFVLGGLIFSGEFLDVSDVVLALTTTVAFCLMSGAAYLVNDVLDADVDRQVARTAGRPIARGDLAPRTAAVAGVAAAAVALALAAAVNLETLAVLAGFALVQVAYSAWLKHLVLIDVMTISAGFTLRSLAGLVAIDVRISEWLLMSTALLALFLGFAKRRAEAVALGGGAQPRRRVLEDYSVAMIDELLTVITPTILVVYCLYAEIGAETRAMLLTAPFVLYGVLRMLVLMHGPRSHETEDPAVVVWRDRPLLACIAGWGVSAAVITALAT
jgi:4-hydroxybenzoate polyprenyltransferase